MESAWFIHRCTGTFLARCCRRGGSNNIDAMMRIRYFASPMQRKARIHQKAICYHIFNRGINRRLIFEDDDDRVLFQDLVRRYKDL
jgi:hypothetical protein